MIHLQKQCNLWADVMPNTSTNNIIARELYGKGAIVHPSSILIIFYAASAILNKIQCGLAMSRALKSLGGLALRLILVGMLSLGWLITSIFGS